MQQGFASNLPKRQRFSSEVLPQSIGGLQPGRKGPPSRLRKRLGQLAVRSFQRQWRRRFAYRLGSSAPWSSTEISLASSGSSVVVTFPQGKRTQSREGVSGIANTETALSCDQYPLPAWISRTGPPRSPNSTRSCAPIPLGFPGGPAKRTRKPGFAVTL